VREAGKNHAETEIITFADEDLMKLLAFLEENHIVYRTRLHVVEVPTNV
jgi:hypothetical protein